MIFTIDSSYLVSEIVLQDARLSSWTAWLTMTIACSPWQGEGTELCSSLERQSCRDLLWANPTWSAQPSSAWAQAWETHLILCYRGSQLCTALRCCTIKEKCRNGCSAACGSLKPQTLGLSNTDQKSRQCKLCWFNTDMQKTETEQGMIEDLRREQKDSVKIELNYSFSIFPASSSVREKNTFLSRNFPSPQKSSFCLCRK